MDHLSSPQYAQNDEPPGDVQRMSKTLRWPGVWAAGRALVFDESFPRLWDAASEPGGGRFQFNWKAWVAKLVDARHYSNACKAMLAPLWARYNDRIADDLTINDLCPQIAKAVIELEYRRSLQMRTQWLRQNNTDSESHGSDESDESKLMTRVRAAITHKRPNVESFIRGAFIYFAKPSVGAARPIMSLPHSDNVTASAESGTLAQMVPTASESLFTSVHRAQATPFPSSPTNVAMSLTSDSVRPGAPASVAFAGQQLSDEVLLPQSLMPAGRRLVSRSVPSASYIPSGETWDMGGFRAPQGPFVSSDFDLFGISFGPDQHQESGTVPMMTESVQTEPYSPSTAYFNQHTPITAVKPAMPNAGKEGPPPPDSFPLRWRPFVPESSILDPLVVAVTRYENGLEDEALLLFRYALGCDNDQEATQTALRYGLTLWHFVWLRAADAVRSRLAHTSCSLNLFARLEPLLTHIQEARTVGTITAAGAKTLQDALKQGNFAAKATYGYLLCYHGMEKLRSQAGIGAEMNPEERERKGIEMIIESIQEGNLIAPHSLVAIIQDYRRPLKKENVQLAINGLVRIVRERGIVSYHLGHLLDYERADLCSYRRDVTRACQYFIDAVRVVDMPRDLRIRASRQLGQMFAYGDGEVRCNLREAESWLRLGMEADDKDSIAHLGNLQFRRQRYNEAYKLFERFFKSPMLRGVNDVHLTAIQSDVRGGVPRRTYHFEVTAKSQMLFLSHIREGLLSPLELDERVVKTYGKLICIESH